MMTPAEKAVETRKRNSEARKQKDREKVEIRKKMKENCLRVLDEKEILKHENRRIGRKSRSFTT